MANVHTLTATLEARTRDFQQQIQAAEKRLSSLEKASGGASAGLQKMGTLMRGAAAAGVLAFGKEMLGLGVQVEAWGRRFNTVFGDAGAALEQWADDMNERLGMSEERLRGTAAAVGDLFVPMGFARDRAAQLTQEVLTLSAALSEWTGGTRSAAEASDIITRAILGEREALIGLGVKISEEDVKQRLLANGAADLTGDLLAQARAQATLELITERSADAMTAFADGGSDAMRAQKSLEAALDDLQVSLSQIVLKLAPFVELVADLISIIPEAGTVIPQLTDDIKEQASAADLLAAEFGILAGEYRELQRRSGVVGTEVFRFEERLRSVTREARGMSDAIGEGIDPSKYATLVGQIRDSFANPMEKIVHDVIGAFQTMPEQVDMSVSELQAVFDKHLKDTASWESNLKRLVLLGFDSIAAEFRDAGPGYATLLAEMLNEPLLASLTQMEADIDGFNSRVNVADMLGSSFAAAGLDFSLFADLRGQLGMTAEAWIRYWAAAAGVGGVNPGVVGPGRVSVQHSGGIVPGPTGMAVPILAMAGERVVPTGVSAGGGGGGGGVVNVYVAGSVVSERQLVDQIRAALRNDRIRGGSLEL